MLDRRHSEFADVPGLTPPRRDERAVHDGLRPLDPARLPDHLGMLYRAAYGLCGSREDAEDLVQETYERVLRRPRFLRHDYDAAYLMRVLRNTWITQSRNAARRPRLTDDDEVEFVADPRGDTAATAAEMRCLYEAIQQLPPAFREAIVAVDIVGLTYAEAARALRTPRGTILSRVFRARDRVAQHVDSHRVKPKASRRSS